jgi:hypothetical protein
MKRLGYLAGWDRYLHGDVLAWLLEADNASARYLILTQLLGRPDADLEAREARQAIVQSAPARDILDAQYPQGYWIKPDRGHSPKYRATMWQVLFLAELGAPCTASIARACEHLLGHAYVEGTGLFSARKAPSGATPCLNGSLLWALRWFGYGDQPIVRAVSERLAQIVLDEGFGCHGNAPDGKDHRSWLACAPGAVKVLRAYAAIPVSEWSPCMAEAVQSGIRFLLAHDLAVSKRPYAQMLRRHWLQLLFPLACESDVLEALEVLADLGRGRDPRLGGAVRLLLSKQMADGRWPLDRTLSRTWASFGRRGQPNKWITLRALRALAGIDPSVLTKELGSCTSHRYASRYLDG